MEKNEVATGGTSLCTLLTVAFVVLKLTGFIDWSWWWVLSPIWIPTALVLVVLAVIFLFFWSLRK